MKNITQALSEIQSKLHAPKNQRNDFGKYNYRNAEGIIAAFKECQNGNESLTLTDSVVVVGERIFLKATATFHCEGETVSVDGWAMHAMQKKGMDDAQITGSCSSYARKYALCGLFAIDDSEQDPDSKDNRAKQESSPQVTPAEIETVIGKIKSCQSMEELAGFWKELSANQKHIAAHKDIIAAKDVRKSEIQER